MLPVLNISIPTYNRPDFLHRCLLSIRDAVLGLDFDDRPLVSVFVSDNSNNNDSLHIVKSSIFSELNIKYSRNIGNIGSDRNIARCYLYEFSKYVMILGDDDFLSKNSLRTLIPLLKREEYSIYFLRAYGLTGDEPELRSDKLRSMRVFNSIKEVVLERNIDLAFISNMIFRRSSYTEDEVESGIGTSLVQLNLVLKLLRITRGKSLYIDADFILSTRNNTGGYNPVNVFVKNYFTLISENIEKDIRADYAALRKRMIHSFYNRSFAQYMRLNNTALSNESLLILNAYYSSFCAYKFFYRPLFKWNSIVSFYLLSFSYILGKIVYTRGSKVRDFKYHLFQKVKLFLNQ